MVVKEPIKLILTNFEGEEVFKINNNFSPEDISSRDVTFSNELYIERDDFSINPPPKYKRFTVGGLVRLYGACIIKYVSHKVDDEGNVIEVKAEVIENSRSGQENANMKVPGVIHWVNAKDCVDCKLHEYDYLLLDGDGDFDERINPNSHIEYMSKAEKSVLNFKPYERFQFMRIGYFSAVGSYSKNNIEFNQIVSLKDSFKI